MKIHHLFLVLLLSSGVSACGDDSDDSHANHNHHGHHDHDATDDTEMCKKADIFSTSLARDTDKGSFKVTFTAANPAPPDVGKNTWTVFVTDKDGTPLEGATVIAEPRMPHHGHGTHPPTFDGTPDGEPGHYKMTDIDFTMSGYWETVITVSDKDGNTDEVMFIFCLEG